MKRALLKHTQVRVTLAINVQVNRQQEAARLIALPLLSLTTLAMLVWYVRLVAGQVGYGLAIQAGKLQAAAGLTVTVFSIAFKSLAFGLGVSL